MMMQHDDAASRVLRNKVWGKTEINLIYSERMVLASWFALFLPRAPIVRSAFERWRSILDKDPEIAVEAMLLKGRDAVLSVMRQDDPKMYDHAIATLGKIAGEEWLLNVAMQLVREKKIPYLPDPAATHHQHLYSVEKKLNRIARRLIRMRWIWFRSASGFCISDNPICRWHLAASSPVWNASLMPGMEITVPLSKQLTLCIDRGRQQRRGHLVQYCGRKRTRDFNLRQKMNSLTKVYGSSREILNPQSRFGFDAPLPSTFTNRTFQLPF